MSANEKKPWFCGDQRLPPSNHKRSPWLCTVQGFKRRTFLFYWYQTFWRRSSSSSSSSYCPPSFWFIQPGESCVLASWKKFFLLRTCTSPLRSPPAIPPRLCGWRSSRAGPRWGRRVPLSSSAGRRRRRGWTWLGGGNKQCKSDTKYCLGRPSSSSPPCPSFSQIPDISTLYKSGNSIRGSMTNWNGNVTISILSQGVERKTLPAPQRCCPAWLATASGGRPRSRGRTRSCTSPCLGGRLRVKKRKADIWFFWGGRRH